MNRKLSLVVALLILAILIPFSVTSQPKPLINNGRVPPTDYRWDDLRVLIGEVVSVDSELEILKTKTTDRMILRLDVFVFGRDTRIACDGSESKCKKGTFEVGKVYFLVYDSRTKFILTAVSYSEWKGAIK